MEASESVDPNMQYQKKDRQGGNRHRDIELQPKQTKEVDLKKAKKNTILKKNRTRANSNATPDLSPKKQ